MKYPHPEHELGGKNEGFGDLRLLNLVIHPEIKIHKLGAFMRQVIRQRLSMPAKEGKCILYLLLVLFKISFADMLHR